MGKKRIAVKILLIVLPLLALGFAALPNAIVMHFMADPAVGGTYDVYCSFYDSLPFGYGNWFPMLTLILAATAAILSFRDCKEEYPAYRGAVTVISLLGAVTSVMSAPMDRGTYVVWIIAAVLVAEAVIAFWNKDK